MPRQAGKMMGTVKIWINGFEVMAESGQSILQAAEDAGVHIPRLCYHPALEPIGSCRLCAVEIDGHRGLPAACSTQVAEGMRIWTQSPRVIAYRREMLRLLLENHPRQCISCLRSGTCELQELVASVGIDFPYTAPTRPMQPVKKEGAYFERDYSLCVGCGRCVRICHEVRGVRAIVFRETEEGVEVTAPLGLSLKEAGCEFCGACVDVCPTGALRDSLAAVYDDPSTYMKAICSQLTDIVLSLYKRGVPLRKRSFICPVCGAGCRLTVQVTETDELIKIGADPRGYCNNGQACVKGRFVLRESIEKRERIVSPIIKREGEYKPIGWPEALDKMSKFFKKWSPDKIAFLTDARVTNEELYIFKRFVRNCFKADHMCLLQSPEELRAAQFLEEVLGTSGITFSLKELNKAPLVLCLGVNPAATHPIAGVRIRQATLSGSTLIVGNPLEVNSARTAELHLRYYPGTESLLLACLTRELIDNGGVDEDVLSQHTQEILSLRESLEPYSGESVSKMTGVPVEELEEVGKLLTECPGFALLFGPAVLVGSGAEDVVTGMITLLYLKASFGRPGQGLAPLYGSANSRGSREMGWKGSILDLLEDGKINALYIAAEDGSDLGVLSHYLQDLEFVVFHGRSLEQMGEFRPDMVFPLRSLVEKSGTVTSLDGLVQWTDPIFSGPKDSWSMVMLAQAWAERMGLKGFDLRETGSIFDAICSEIPSYKGFTLGRLKTQPLQIPQKVSLPRDMKPLWNRWTSSLPGRERTVCPEGFEFIVMAIEDLKPYFFGPQLAPESQVLFCQDGEFQMNPGDIYTKGWEVGEKLAVIYGENEVRVKVSMNRLLAPGTVAISQEKLRRLVGDGVTPRSIYSIKVEKR